ncbi:MAG: EFR1 family ferrodoxin [Promethearchaeota archaeon]
MKIALIYFSATGNTSKFALFFKKELTQLNVKIDLFDITSYKSRQKELNLEKYDAFIFGFPIYAWQAPKVVIKWLKKINGKNKNCSVFFTYGGVSTGAAHYNISQILKGQNFNLIATAEFICKHTYSIGGWGLMEDRPNQEDFNIATQFIKIIYNKFIGKENNFLKLKNPNISTETLKRIEIIAKKGIPPPSRDGKDCSLCRKCEELCPTNAMNADSGNPDENLCIRCFRCIVICPDKALLTQDLKKQFEFIKKANKLTEEILKNKKSKIYY